MKNLQVTDLEWPEGSTFVHTPFAIIGAMPTYKRYAELSSVQKAFVWHKFATIKMSKSFIEDILGDRGFISK